MQPGAKDGVVAVRGPRLTLALLLGVVVVVLLGTGAALTISGAQRRAAAGPAGPPRVSASSSPAGSAPPAQATAATRTGARTAATTGPSTNLTVQLAPAARSHPRAEQVQDLLQAYFDAINNHDYAAWSVVVTTAQSERQNSDRWLDAYASTVDSSIWIQSLSGSPLRAAVRFTSEQDPDLAPPDLQVRCIDWVLSYEIDQQGDRLAVGSTVPGSVSHTKCA
jgi:hypothetical protein